jgi:hypothetical protein
LQSLTTANLFVEQSACTRTARGCRRMRDVEGARVGCAPGAGIFVPVLTRESRRPTPCASGPASRSHRRGGRRCRCRGTHTPRRASNPVRRPAVRTTRGPASPSAARDRRETAHVVCECVQHELQSRAAKPATMEASQTLRTLHRTEARLHRLGAHSAFCERVGREHPIAHRLAKRIAPVAPHGALLRLLQAAPRVRTGRATVDGHPLPRKSGHDGRRSGVLAFECAVV